VGILAGRLRSQRRFGAVPRSGRRGPAAEEDVRSTDRAQRSVRARERRAVDSSAGRG